MSEQEKQKKVDRLIERLHSAKESEISAALQDLRESGSPKVITPIVLLLNHKSTHIAEEAKIFLLDLKYDAALPVIFEAISKETNIENKNFLISLLWNTRLDASEHLLNLVELLREGNYMTCVEILTVIENLKGPFSNEEKDEAVFILYEIKENNDDESLKMLYHQIEKVLKELSTDEF